jgi:hypothetical protein
MMPGRISIIRRRAGRQPLVGDDQRDGENDDCNAEAKDGEGALERLEPRARNAGGVEQERPQHDQKAERQQTQGCHQHIGDRFEAEQDPIPRLHHAVGPVEDRSAGSRLRSMRK